VRRCGLVLAVGIGSGCPTELAPLAAGSSSDGTSSHGESSSSSGAPTSSSGPVGYDESGGTPQSGCRWTHERAPEVFAEMMLDPGKVARAVASPDGSFYLVGHDLHSDPSSGLDIDLSLWKLSGDGKLLWSARWGNAYGWDDEPYDLWVGPEGVFVAGAAGIYRREEFYHLGHTFVRAYTHGGVVRWTWEDEGGPSPEHFFERVRMMAPLGQDLLVASSIPVNLGEDYLRAVILSPQGEQLDAWTYEREGRFLAAHVDASHDVLMAISDLYNPWLGRWRPDGTFVDPEIWDRGGNARAAAFVGDEGLTLVGGGGGSLAVLRFDSLLGFPEEQLYTFEHDGSSGSYSVDVAMDCAGAAWVATDSPTVPLGAYDAKARQLWAMDGLSVVAVADDGVALTAGYDAGEDATVIRWLRTRD